MWYLQSVVCPALVPISLQLSFNCLRFNCFTAPWIPFSLLCSSILSLSLCLFYLFLSSHISPHTHTHTHTLKHTHTDTHIHFLWPRLRQGSCKRPHQCGLTRSDSSLYHSLALTTDRWIPLTHTAGGERERERERGRIRGRGRGKRQGGWFSSIILFSWGCCVIERWVE